MRTKKMMKNLLLLVFCTLVCSLWVGTSVKAESVEKIQCGPSAYAVLDDLGTLTITGSGGMYDYSSDLNNHELYQSFSNAYNVKIGDGITYIGKNAFREFGNLQSVSIGKSVKKIGDCAFSGCDGNMFTDLVIPSNVQEIGEWAFYHCEYLKNLTLQTGLKKIGGWAFSYCYALQNVSIPEGVSTIESFAFWRCGTIMQITIPKNIGAIKYTAFSGHSDNKYTTTSATVTVYAKNAMLAQDCFDFDSVTVRCYRGTTAEKYTRQHDKATCEYMGVDSTLYFNANGGKCGVSSKRVTSEYCYGELPVPTRKGYIFTGWYTQQNGGTKITNGTIITQEKNTTIYAHWTKLSVGKTTITRLSNKANRKVTVAIKKISGAKGYEVQYSRYKSMKKAKIKRKSTATITVGSLKKGSTYYVKARAYKIDSQGKRVYGKWSGVKKIKIRK